MSTEIGRNKTLDIAKAICIILMVTGHSGCPEYVSRFIYMFHMPCFFFISGWLLSDKYISNLKLGIFKKLKGSYYPFVKWSLIFLLLHNVFAFLHFYDISYQLKDFGIKAVRILTMTGGEQLLGGYWFLISLCWASIFSVIFLHVVKWYKLLSINIFAAGGVIILLAIAILQNNISVNIPQQFGSQTILATAFYISGFLYKKLNFKYQNPLALGIFLLLIPAIVAVFFKWGMIGCKGWIVLPYYAVSMIGTIGILNISKVFADKSLIVKPLTYIGDKTLYILTFHFVCFKLISYIYIKINRLPITQLTSFPTIDTPAAYLWIIYTITGVCLSVLIWRILHPKYINFKLYKQLK